MTNDNNDDHEFVHTEQSLKDLRRQLLEQTSDWDPQEPISGVALEAMTGDEYVDSTCTKCGFGRALFMYEHKYVLICPSCTTDRIETIVASGRPIPVSLRYLHYETQTEVSAQTFRRTDNVVRLVPCRRCSKLLRERECRYWFPEGSNSSPPYCLACFETLRPGNDTP